MQLPTWKRKPGPRKEIVGIDVFFDAPGVDFIKTEHLCTFDGELGFSLGQGQ